MILSQRLLGHLTTLYVSIVVVTQASTTSPAPANCHLLSSGQPNSHNYDLYQSGYRSCRESLDNPTRLMTRDLHRSLVDAQRYPVKSQTITVIAATTPTAQQPTATPQATVAKSTPAPQATTVINIYVPPTTVINNVIPGTVTQGTNNKWGCPEVTVKNPGPDKLRTTILDFAKTRRQYGALQRTGRDCQSRRLDTHGPWREDVWRCEQGLPLLEIHEGAAPPPRCWGITRLRKTRHTG